LETNPIQKSESFFEKVDAAESETSAKKSRKNLLVPLFQDIHYMYVGSSIAKTVTRKDGPKQATLFGMMSKTTPLQKKNENSASETQTTQIDSQTTDSQSSDVLMSDVGHLDAASTQEDSQQRAFSPDWDIEDDSL